ncbi:hypothetical protein [Muriicola sp. Z0-33]|uniref:ThuA domain-containing protein n=1 Tax=Muriicola sp. Z0-33 TaxID=2816957 RepID=UPI002238B088|nr:hypothetical protein [Muriicola sp. Z0-33]MCW5516880.1 hypothetical protein [Muriicola sp. Z0-33]
MKNLIYIVVCILLISCKQDKKQEQQDAASTPEVAQWLTYEGSEENGQHIVLISGDEEYRSEEALPQLAKILSQHHGFKCTVLFAQHPDKPGIVNANYVENIAGLEVLEQADMMFIFTRFRALPDDQMAHIDNYLMSGKPVVGIRTSTHAFNFSETSTSKYTHYSNGYAGEKTEWTDGFGRLVLGEKWISHHGHHKHQSTRGVIAPGNEQHEITNGLAAGDIWGSTDVYGVRLPLPGDSEPIILGQVVNRAGEYDEEDIWYGMQPTDSEVAMVNNQGVDVSAPLMPIAWTKSYQLPGGSPGRAFASTIGSSSDLLTEGVRRLLINGAYWAMELPVPPKANVDLVGDYNPTQYEFRDDAYWEERQMKIADLE